MPRSPMIPGSRWSAVNECDEQGLTKLWHGIEQVCNKSSTVDDGLVGLGSRRSRVTETHDPSPVGELSHASANAIQLRRKGDNLDAAVLLLAGYGAINVLERLEAFRCVSQVLLRMAPRLVARQEGALEMIAKYMCA